MTHPGLPSIPPPERWSNNPSLVKFELSLDMYKLPMPVMERLRGLMANPSAAQAYLTITMTQVMIFSAGFEETEPEGELRLVLTGETAVSGTVDIL